MDKQENSGEAVSIDVDQAIICDEYGQRLAIFVVNTDWSEIDYDGEGEQLEVTLSIQSASHALDVGG